MNSDSVLANNEMTSSMGKDKPYASYIKTILGQAAVVVWDNVLQKPVDVILRGNPKKKEEDCIVKVWDAKEDAFFKRMNRSHFQKGVLIPYDYPVDFEPVKTIEQATDAELLEVVNSKYMSLVAKLNKIESIPVLFRMKGIAEEAEKSEKITAAIEKRISELQTAEYIAPSGEPKAEE
jgi:hypothetical protein